MIKPIKLLLPFIVIVITAAAAAADDPCPCIPLSYTWLAEPCGTWNCAASALVLADGDPNVVIMPTASDKFKWVILRRIVTGSVTVSPDAPFVVEHFSSMNDGSARFSTIEQDQSPLLLTPASGNVLVVYLREKEDRSHAVPH
jgi:hypothetical protein